MSNFKSDHVALPAQHLVLVPVLALNPRRQLILDGYAAVDATATLITAAS